MSLKDFDAARRERQRDREPVQFQLGGEEFMLPAVIPVGLAFDLLEKQGDGTNEGLALVAMRDFLYEVLASDEDRERMKAVLYSRDDPIEGGDLFELVNALALEYAGRPTQRSTESSAGPQTNGSGSKPASSATEEPASATSTSES